MKELAESRKLQYFKVNPREPFRRLRQLLNPPLVWYWRALTALVSHHLCHTQKILWISIFSCSSLSFFVVISSSHFKRIPPLHDENHDLDRKSQKTSVVLSNGIIGFKVSIEHLYSTAALFCLFTNGFQLL